jgi:hypothetical protein
MSSYIFADPHLGARAPARTAALWCHAAVTLILKTTAAMLVFAGPFAGA